MDAALPQKHLKIYNLTTRNGTLIKLTMILYLHKKFNVAEDWSVTPRAQEGVNQKPFKMSQEMNFWLNFRCFLRIK